MKSIVLSLCVLLACGSEGETGLMGEMGEMGVPGPQGPVGPQGPTGAKGATGAQGPAGVAGAQGPIGPAGAIGAQGPAGATGAQGPAGPQGVQGTQGPAGATGAQGPQGAQGSTGPAVHVYAWNNVHLGILISAEPGNETYVSDGDGYTLVPDGLIVQARVSSGLRKVWYTNSDCTGTAYVVEGFGYEPIAEYVYLGRSNTLYTASTSRAFPSPTVVQSYSPGGASCTAQNISAYLHAVTSRGSASDPAASMPWHVVVE